MSSFDDLIDNVVEKIPKTYVAIVFDKSGSMASLQNEVVDGLNDEVKTIQESTKDQDVKLSLTFFSNKVSDSLYWNIDVNEFKNIKKEDYVPEGLTALYDAIGKTIKRLQKEKDIDDPNVSVLMLIVTDGMENNSKKFTSKQIFDIINELKSTDRWTFTYIGTGDLQQISSNLGFDVGNMKSFSSSKDGYLQNKIETQSSYTSYFEDRSKGITGSRNFHSK
jgi:uncharacterized protein YegL